MMKLSFDERRATQVAGILLGMQDWAIDRLKLFCLLYICERRNFDRWGDPMIGDEYVATPEGPALKSVLALTSADRLRLPRDSSSYWNQFLGTGRFVDSPDPDRLDVFCRKRPPPLGIPLPTEETSPADREIIEGVIKKFGDYNAAELARHTRGFAEFHNPGGSIPVEAILTALGKTPAHIKCIIEDLEEHEYVTRLLA